MNSQYIKGLRYFTGLILLAGLFAACSKMDATYIGFIKKGSIVYVGSPDSLKVYSGKNRLKLEWMLSDPSTTKAKIYWNNKTDSLVLPVSVDPVTKKMSVWLNNIREGSYSFAIILYDKDNNTSIITNAIGRVYGDTYINTLLPRPAKRAIFEAGKVTVSWGAADVTVIGTELIYFDKTGQENKMIVPTTASTTELINYDWVAHETFQCRTLYRPDSLSIDTFYTSTQSVKVTGPPMEYLRTSWIAGTEDYDIPSGRMPKNALDNNPSTVWHMDKTHGYPHTMTVDMNVANLITGFTYIQRTPLDGPVKMVEIQVSSDGAIWKSMGAYTFESIGTKQFLELVEPVTARYFKLIVKSDYKNGTFTALAELGVYK